MLKGLFTRRKSTGTNWKEIMGQITGKLGEFDAEFEAEKAKIEAVRQERIAQVDADFEADVELLGEQMFRKARASLFS